MSNFRDVDRQTGFLLPPSVDEWLPQRHLARFVVEVIDGLDLRALVGSYRGSGSASYHPSMSQPVLRPRSRRCWRPDGRRITPPWTSALPRHRRCQSTRRRSKPCCIAWRRLKARELYAQCKHIPEPVFGIIKSVLGFRQFLLRGLDKVRGEWSLVPWLGM
jgi:hypothetical protein